LKRYKNRSSWSEEWLAMTSSFVNFRWVIHWQLKKNQWVKFCGREQVSVSASQSFCGSWRQMEYISLIAYIFLPFQVSSLFNLHFTRFFVTEIALNNLSGFTQISQSLSVVQDRHVKIFVDLVLLINTFTNDSKKGLTWYQLI
jgi:hypothetical protein